MRDKIDRFAKGIFSFDHPELIASTGNISIPAEAGKAYEGSFTVSSSSFKPFKFFITASDSLISFEKDSFYGIENEVRFRFDAEHLDINDAIQGNFSIISEFGEMDIPFTAKCRVPACNTSIGPASDLFHFTSLAQSNWAEAKTLFRSEEFRKNLVYYNVEYRDLSETLLKSGNVSLALEQFLISAHKKKPVHISCDSPSLNFENIQGKTTGSLILKRDTWGYTQLEVEVNGDFIEPERRVIFSEDFEGNEFTLSVTVDPLKLHGGTNYGAVTLIGTNDRLTIPVVCKYSGESMRDRLSKRRKRYFDMKLISVMLDFRLGKLSKSRLVHEADKTLENLKMFRDETISDKLLRCYLYYLGGKTSQAQSVFNAIGAGENLSDKDTATLLFLEAVSANDPVIAASAVDRLRELHEHTADASIFLYLIELDEKKRLSRSVKYNTLKAAERGQSSPFVLLEACRQINEEPTVMKEFAGFDLNAFIFGLKNDQIGKDAVRFAAYLAARSKTVGELQIRALELAYSKFKLKEVLEALCQQIVLSGDTSANAYKWLSAGIEDNVPVNNIFESCLRAAGKADSEPLPKALTEYFESGLSAVDDECREAYYANTVRFRTGGRDRVSENTLSEARKFAVSKLAEGGFSENLVYLYNNLLREFDLSESDISGLPGLIFKHRLRIASPGITSVIIAHKELSEEQAYPVENGIAYCDIFTNDVVILLSDDNGSRIVSEKIRPEKLVTNQSLIKLCLEKCTDNEMVILYNLENSKYRGDTHETIELEKRIINEVNLNTRFLLDCKRDLIEYYYDNLEGDMMERLLVSIDLGELNRHDRTRMLGFMIQRELYSLAMRNMELYGFMGVDVRRLSDLAERLLESNDEACDSPVFNAICCYVFFRKSTTPLIARRVVEKYDGSSESLYRLYRTARDMNVDCNDLEERLLYQLLFTQSDYSFSNEVFKHYYGHDTNRKLIRAFLSYYAYKCLVLDYVAEAEMLDIMRHELMYEENDLCSLAILKDMSHHRSFSEANRILVEKKIENLVNKGIILPFFKDFKEEVRLPEGIRERHYVEYHSNPSACVKIHYCLNEDDGDYKEELMKDMGYGIFVSSFILFYGEALQYYISEESEDDYTITESGELSIDPEIGGGAESGYQRINLIITAKEMNDPKTMIKVLESYIKSEYISRELFKPII